MNDETPEQGDDFDDVLAAEDEEFPEGEYRLSTRPGVVSGAP
ncbi:hypothetical protein OG342_06780 [Streptomyces bobili]|nr:hypothetical protein [Streptomyces bobili]MCX5522567.1 hypothetical protein [Streptomyces bobili]